MRELNRRADRWSREHPWRWAALLGALVSTSGAALRLGVFHRPLWDSVQLGLVTGALWFAVYGLGGWLRLRKDRARREAEVQ